MEKSIFCANCQAVTTHSVARETYSKEVVCTCTTCQHFIKLPIDTNQATLLTYIDEHNSSNLPLDQVALNNQKLEADTRAALEGKDNAE